MLNGGAKRREHACTNPQKEVGDTYTQAARPNSARLYSAARLAHLTSERIHFSQGGKVMSSPSGG